MPSLSWRHWLLALSLVADVVVTATWITSSIDLRVYDGAVSLLPDGGLYDFSLGEHKPGDQRMPFTYPPFAALLFLPLALLPFEVLKWTWHAIAIAATWWAVRRTAGELGRPQWTEPAVAVLIWLEPVRVTLMYGQVNLVLLAVVLTGVLAPGVVRAGTSVGVAAGIKLTPAITGLYLLATRRYAAAALSAGVFAATVAVSFLLVPGQATRYWTELFGDTGQVGPIGTVLNQSIRGAVARLTGEDPGFSAAWAVPALLAAALAVAAVIAAVRAGDRIAALVAVQFAGLLLAPISWSHHYVWVVPALLWAFTRTEPLARAAGVLWVLATGSWVVKVLLEHQPDGWVFSRPGWESVLGCAYPVAALCTLAAIVVTHRRAGRAPAPAPTPAPRRSTARG